MTSDRNNQRGFTLIEVAVALAISGILLGGIVGILAGQIRIPFKIRTELNASAQLQQAMAAISEDANSARSFTPGTDPTYGTFDWFELTGKSPIPMSVRYYWEDGTLFRELTRNNQASPPRAILDDVPTFASISFSYTAPEWTFSDISKEWTYREGQVEVSATSTRDVGGGKFEDETFTSSFVAELRPQKDRPVPLPGRLEPPPPPANQIDFRIDGDPNLTTGSLKNGSGDSLTFDDSDHYEVQASGNPRSVVWEATSEPIDYDEITDITVEFTGQVTKAGATQEIFVFNADDPDHTDGGYDTSPDQATVYATGGADQTVTFAFSEADVTYVDSLATKVVKIKIKTTNNINFNHLGDKLVFKVAGTPSSTFSRDFVVETNPTIENGTYKAGNAASLTTDDTDFWTVEEVSSTVQWVAESEPINLDTISSIEVRFIGRVTKGTPLQEIFVFNPGAHGGDGYDATADSSHVYSTTGADEAVSFFLNSEDIEFVNSLFPKVVRLRVMGTDTSPKWALEADKLIFRVKP